jgi:tetratricopeptide (TPR) repeat protein
LNLYYDRLDPDLTIDVLFHEGNLLLTHMFDVRFMYPPWINESMAEYFGASKWDPKTKKMSMGHLQAGRLTVVKEAIRKNEWLKLKDMIEMESFGSLHYAWGWTFIHYLMESKKYQKGFEKFYTDLPKKTGIKRVPWGGRWRTVPPDEQMDYLIKCLPGIKDLDQLEKEWHAYVKELNVADMAGYEQAGRYMRLLGRYKDAEEYLAKAIEMGSTQGATFGAYGDVLIKRNKADKAIEALTKAIELDPLTAKYHFWLGIATRRGPGEEAKAKGLQFIKLAAEIEPEDIEIEWWLADVDQMDDFFGKPPKESDGD